MTQAQKVVVRFPPSPTGPFHVGSARTALFNYLFARHNGGQLVLRIEDTDKERSKKEYEEDILASLEWLGIEHDNDEIFRQSERTEIYKKYLEKLISEDKAYFAEERKADENESRSTSSGQVIRFRNPNKKIKFEDLIRGDIEFDTTELGDFVIAKSLEEPIYHLVVVIDDFESGVTHVIRGEDGISNTPRQILIQEAIGAPRPIYAHLPLMLDTDKAKLSKRKQGEKVSVSYYRRGGYLPQAMINFLAMVGWNSGTEQEFFSMQELIEVFDIAKVQKKGAIFNVEKLDWLNREYLLRQAPEVQLENLKSQVEKTKWSINDKWQEPGFTEKFLKIILARIRRWGEVSESLETGEYDYLFEKPVLDPQKIMWKKQDAAGAKEKLTKILEIMESSSTNYESAEQQIMQLAEREGKGEVLWPLRYSLSGKEKSPDPQTLLDILGAAESKERIQNAIQIL